MRAAGGLPVRDWAAYDRALALRGDITVWISPEAIAGWCAPAGRRTFSDAAIAAALTVRTVYRLALRQAEGLIRSIITRREMRSHPLISDVRYIRFGGQRNQWWRTSGHGRNSNALPAP